MLYHRHLRHSFSFHSSKIIKFMLLIFRFTNYLQQFRITIVIFAFFVFFVLLVFKKCSYALPQLLSCFLFSFFFLKFFPLYANLLAALCDYSKMCFFIILLCCYCVRLVIRTKSYIKGTSIIIEFKIR